VTGTDILAADRLAKAFTPNRPIDLPQLLSGRLDLLYRLQDIINTQGQHAILYGDRGVGKTSIARVLAILSQEPSEPNGNRAILISCDSRDDYASLWRKIFQEVLLAERQLGFGTSQAAAIVGRWNPDTSSIMSPNDVRLLIGGLLHHMVIVIDEFDRIPNDSDACRLMADTIKLFSDMNTRCTLILVGVADSIGDLIAEHQSISRNIAQVPVDVMSSPELAQIIQKGYGSAGLEFDADLANRCAFLSQGYPHYTHLLGLWTGRKAIERGSKRVTAEDLEAAIPTAIENTAGGIQLEYDVATDSNQPDNLFKPVLLACALADKDARGRFGVASLRDPLQRILNRPVIRAVAYQSHLAKFCEDSHGPVLRRSGTRRNYRWQFINPQLIPFVRLQGLRSGLLAE
jgi:Cdc6-like AAA superfamily ATPase